MRYFLLSICLALAACARSDANLYGGLAGQSVVGNEAYVSVSNVWNERDALPLADSHCGKYGKVARYTGTSPGYGVTFDCVAKRS